MITRVSLSCLLFTFLAAQGYCLGIGSSEPGFDIEAGKRIYAKHCAPCHGEKAVGQDTRRRFGGWDAKGVPIAPALNGTAHTWHHSPEFLFNYVSKGSIIRKSPMPSFGDTLDRQDILSVIAYLQSLWPEEIRRDYFKKYK